MPFVDSQQPACPILAIETSGLVGSIALSGNDAIIERQLATEGRRHAQTLTLEIQELLQAYGLTPGDLQGVAVSLGPGSFTGLRVGLVCAKTLAYALDCPLLGVETFASIVDHLDPSSLPDTAASRCFVVSDAQRGDFYLAEYRPTKAEGWLRQGDFQIVPGRAWAAGLTPEDVILGPGVSRLQDADTPAIIRREDWSLQPSARAICRIAQSRLWQGFGDDPWTLAPIYLRPSAAEEQRARRDAAPHRA